jgi:hypothetical protein
VPTKKRRIFLLHPATEPASLEEQARCQATCRSGASQMAPLAHK